MDKLRSSLGRVAFKISMFPSIWEIFYASNRPAKVSYIHRGS